MEVTSEHSIHELHFVVSTYQVYFFFLTLSFLLSQLDNGVTMAPTTSLFWPVFHHLLDYY